MKIPLKSFVLGRRKAAQRASPIAAVSPVTPIPQLVLTEEHPTPTSSSNPQTEQRETRRFVKATLTGLLHKVATALDDVHVPGVGVGIRLLVDVFDNIETVHSNNETLESLKMYFEKILSSLEEARLLEQETLDPNFSEDIRAFRKRLDERFEIWSRRFAPDDNWKKVRRFLEASINEKDLQELSAEIDREVANFIVTNVAVIRSSLRLIEERRQAMKIELLVRDNRAAFNSAFNKERGVTGCLEGTRVEILQRIKSWVTDFNFDGLDKPHIFWLNGIAGIGKSAIAYSISQWAAREQILGASFFFNHNPEKISDWPLHDPQSVFPTISYQLCISVPGYLSALVRALDRNPDAGSKPPSDQFRLLIHGPLEDAELKFPDKTILVVLDAIDECRSKEGISELLGTLLRLKTKRRVLVLITGRPEPSVQDFFLMNTGNFETEALQDLPDDISKLDIEKFLRNNFMRDQLPPFCLQSPDFIPSSWPTKSDFDWLLEDCGILFIYATTLIRYIFDDEIRDPLARLQSLKENRVYWHHSTKLEGLYSLILQNARQKTQHADAVTAEEATRNILETVVLLPNPLPNYHLCRFIKIDKNVFKRSLCHLHSVMLIPDANSTTESLRFFHKSFPDFIVDSKRHAQGKEAFFLVDKTNTDMNGRMFLRCLDTMMRHLSRNGLVPDARTPPEEIITTPFPPDFRIAHLSWVKFLQRAQKINVEKKLEKFIKEYLLYWLEATSYLGMVEDAEKDLKKVYEWSVKNCCRPLFSEFLYEAYRFIGNNRLLISLDAQQIYRTAMALVPSHSALRRAYDSETLSHSSIRVIRGLSAKWPPLLPVLSLVDSNTPKYPTTVTCIRYTQDRHLLVAGTHDGCVFVLDPTTGSVTNVYDVYVKEDDSLANNLLLQEFREYYNDLDNPRVQGPTSIDSEVELRPKSVKDLRISPDNAYIAAISDGGSSLISVVDVREKTIKSMDCGVPVNSFSFGPKLETLSSDFNPAMPVSLAAATRDGIKICDDVVSAPRWRPVYVRLSGAYDAPLVSVSCVEFLPDGERVIVGCEDKTIRIYNVKFEGELESSYQHTTAITMLSVYPDTKLDQIAFVDESYAVHITNSLLHPPKLAHSHNRRIDAMEIRRSFVASVDTDVLRVKNFARDSVESSTITSPVMDVQCTALMSCPNEELIQVASVRNNEGHYIRRWEIRPFPTVEYAEDFGREGGPALQPPPVCSMAFSPDGTQFVTGGADCIVRVWNASQSSDGELHKLTGHLSKIVLLVFMPDGSRMGSASADGSICIWDAHTWASAPLAVLRLDNARVTDSLELSGGEPLAQMPAPHSTTSAQSPDPALIQADLQVSSMAFSVNGAWLATGDTFGEVHLWDASNGNHFRALTGLSSKPILLAFSPDGSIIFGASMSTDACINVRAWNVESGITVTISRTESEPHVSDKIPISPTYLHRDLWQADGFYFNDNASRIYLRSTRGIDSWDIDELSAKDLVRTNNHKEDLLGIISKPFNPRVLVKKGFFRFGGYLSTCSSRAMLYIAFERKDKWEFISLPTQEVSDIGPVAISLCGQRIAISTPSEREKFLLLDITESESPIRSPVMPLWREGVDLYVFPNAQTDILVRGWHRRIGCQWEEMIDDLILHQTPTVHQDCKECHLISNDLFRHGDTNSTFRANNIRRTFVLQEYSCPVKLFELAPNSDTRHITFDRSN
ncbi:WD40 repeat-like protein [Schizopora paradoxa]|uniref:WD40 repeat-like protein n=1 Tax=Schizopora paradoxa TaxID=27342 RepID=A0A0H2SD85_9AGAM|nr:WD40 repeat-like protein [Schizopora paradoxa]